MQEKYWIFTFGCGQVHAGKYVKIYAENSSDARKEMIDIFGKDWAFQYNNEDEAGVDRWGLIELGS
jgi:hypothetical protein